MNWKTRVIKIAIILALLISLFAAFTLLYGFSDIASAPYVRFEERNSANVVVAEPSYIPETNETPDTAGPPATSDPPEGSSVVPVIPEEEVFVTVQMDRSDIFRGNLLLINHDHNYVIPDDNDFVDVADVKTASYRVTDSTLLLSASIIEPLNNMMDTFYNETGRDNVTIISAFRDYNRQQEILDQYISLMGRAEALKWAALPGHSEHHTGLAVDFGVFSSGALRTFLGTGVHSWFSQNSWQFGFILRYPSGKTEITKTAYEPWHYRYVGKPHAYIIWENGFCFEEYIEYIVGYTRDNPYNISLDGVMYEVYFTQDQEITIPSGSEYEISGNNIDGFIVTIIQYT